MVTRRASDAAPPPTAIAPVVKRKRRASCLGEQERRERKRAIDREAQRSLREKTKTHIAELEKTIQILRDQDRNGATASLLSEIDALRAENERLRDVIDSVKSVVGCEIFGRSNTNAGSSNTANANASRSDGGSPDATGEGRQSSSPRQRANSISTTTDVKPPLPTPTSVINNPIPSHFESMNFGHHMPTTSANVDLDGMTMSSLPHPTPHDLGLNMDLDPVFEIPEDHHGPLLDSSDNSDHVTCPDSPSTAAFAPFMTEIFGPSWRCPSPVVLHIDNAPRTSTAPPSSISSDTALCPIWKKSNELFGKVFSYRPGMATTTTMLNAEIEAGLLYVGIKQGWDTFNEWMQSPALKILKEIDQFLFCHLPRMERLATAYKSYKLLKYYLNANKKTLEAMPVWLRPSTAQSHLSHPIALDFFPWPTLRSRLLHTHPSLFTNTALSLMYSLNLRFSWPFAYEDAFFFDEGKAAYVPSPLFERYHADLRCWSIEGEDFAGEFPDLKADVEGDRRGFCESLGE